LGHYLPTSNFTTHKRRGQQQLTKPPNIRTHTETVKVTTATPVVTVSVTDTTFSPVTYTATVDTTETVTVATVTQTSSQVFAKRADAANTTPVTVVPTALPAYASACTSAARFSSACSCVGITGKVTTAPTPVTTVYVTETQTPAAVTETTAADTTVIATTVQTDSLTLTSTASATATTTVEVGVCKNVRARGVL
jgi:hypothetical protein